MTTVQLFITCLVDSFYPETGEAIVSILRGLGLTVEFPPDQTCCGQPPFNAGLRTEARPIVEHTIRVFEKTDGDIVIPSGSCAHMIKHGYPELFQDDPKWLPRAQALGNRVYEFTEYLVDKLGVTDLGAHWEGTLTYHPSCHTLRGMKIDRQPIVSTSQPPSGGPSAVVSAPAASLSVRARRRARAGSASTRRRSSPYCREAAASSK